MKQVAQDFSFIQKNNIQKFAVVVARFNQEICQGLLTGVQTLCEEMQISKEQMDVHWVPGAFEIPLVAQKLADTKKYDGVIALGCVIRGETAHFDYVCLAATHGCLEASLKTKVPVAFGVLTVDTVEQAKARCQNDSFNKGREAALALFETVQTLKTI